jgi:hypothetical protein
LVSYLLEVVVFECLTPFVLGSMWTRGLWCNMINSCFLYFLRFKIIDAVILNRREFEIGSRVAPSHRKKAIVNDEVKMSAHTN